jgi:transcriptional regulator with XRE-family HTH domain
MLPEIGKTIRAIRKSRGLNIADIAKQTGLTISHISQIERGVANPSLITLSKLAETFGVPITLFFEEGQSKYTVVRAGERKKIILDHTNGYIEYLGGSADKKSLGVYLSNSESEQLGQDYVPHEGTEVFHILEGAMDLYLGQEVIHLDQGDTISFDSTIPHKVVVASAPLKTLVVTTSPETFMETLWKFLP